MREIKFRAWDKFNEILIEPRLILTIHFDRRNQEPNLVIYLRKYMNPTREISDFDKVFCNEFILMQYTGLKDKNGTEIYEGDLYQFTIDEYMDGIYVEKEYTEPVEFHEGAFWVARYLLCDILAEDEESMVVGNIYENPELLEGLK